MATQFITDETGKKTSIIIPINEYEDMLHQHHKSLELTDDYKAMMDAMLFKEEDGTAQYLSADILKKKFLP